MPTSVRLYSEMVIHGEIYKARPDMNSVCHHHAMAVLPFCATGVELVPLFHLGGTLGGKVPFWDSRDEFGDTNLLVRTPEEGASLARALGPHFMVLLRRHGATLVGRSMRECVFRSIYTTHNAELQLRAMAIGTPGPLTPGEPRRPAATTWARAASSGPGNIGACGCRKRRRRGRRAACRWLPARPLPRGRARHPRTRQAGGLAGAAQGESRQAEVVLAAQDVPPDRRSTLAGTRTVTTALPRCSAAAGGVARHGVIP